MASYPSQAATTTVHRGDSYRGVLIYRKGVCYTQGSVKDNTQSSVDFLDLVYTLVSIDLPCDYIHRGESSLCAAMPWCAGLFGRSGAIPTNRHAWMISNWRCKVAPRQFGAAFST